VLDQGSIHEDLPMMLRVAENTQCPISFSVTQADKAPRRWRQTLDSINEASARGLSITAQIRRAPGRAAARTGAVAQFRSRPIRATRRSRICRWPNGSRACTSPRCAPLS